MRGSVLEQLGDAFRKHWILILAIASSVLLAGWLYASRRKPFFEADVKLRIVRSAAGRSKEEFSFSFEEDYVFYNTQYTLLKTQLDWAEQALDRAAWLVLTRLALDPRGEPAATGAEAARRLGAGLDEAELSLLGEPAEATDFPFGPGRPSEPAVRRNLDAVRRSLFLDLWHVGPDSLLDAVRAEPIANTYLARLTFRAADPGVAVFLVNLYAELYRDVSREERKEVLAEQVDELDRQRKESEGKVAQAEKALREFRAAHPDLWPGERLNLSRQEASALATKLDELEMQEILRRADELRFGEVLLAAGVVAEEANGRKVLRASREGTEVTRLLAADSRVLSLPAVAADAGVAACRAEIDAAQEERRRLPADLTSESPAVRKVEERLAELTGKLGAAVETAVLGYLAECARARGTMEDLRARFTAKQEQAKQLDELYTRLEELTRSADTLRAEKDSLDKGYAALSRLFTESETGGSGGRVTIQNIRLERRARLVDAQMILPNKMLLFAMTLCAALLLSIGAAWVREFLDDTIKSKSDFERFVAMPDIGYIPRIQGKESTDRDVAMLVQPSSVVAEAFRSVRTGILFSKRDEEIRSFLITSAGPGEGKTTVAVNLAITMAHADRGRVLLVDSDLRRPRVHKVLGLEDGIGLTNCLVGSSDLHLAIRETKVKNLFVLSSGPTPPNPAELLGGKRMGEILRQVREEFAKVVLDTPPILPVTDASILSTLVDGVFLVISLGRTSWRLVRRAQETLKAVGIEPTGAILNNVRSKSRAYGYQYGYDQKDR